MARDQMTAPEVLPPEARKLWEAEYQNGFNKVCNSYFGEDHQACAASYAWAAVKQSFQMNQSGDWIERACSDCPDAQREARIEVVLRGNAAAREAMHASEDWRKNRRTLKELVPRKKPPFSYPSKKKPHTNLLIRRIIATGDSYNSPIMAPTSPPSPEDSMLLADEGYSRVVEAVIPLAIAGLEEIIATSLDPDVIIRIAGSISKAVKPLRPGQSASAVFEAVAIASSKLASTKSALNEDDLSMATSRLVETLRTHFPEVGATDAAIMDSFLETRSNRKSKGRALSPAPNTTAAQVLRSLALSQYNAKRAKESPGSPRSVARRSVGLGTKAELPPMMRAGPPQATPLAEPIDDPYQALRGGYLMGNSNRPDGLRFASADAEKIYNESLIKPPGTPFLKVRDAADRLRETLTYQEGN